METFTNVDHLITAVSTFPEEDKKTRNKTQKVTHMQIGPQRSPHCPASEHPTRGSILV
jgi:hypothetical protein